MLACPIDGIRYSHFYAASKERSTVSFVHLCGPLLIDVHDYILDYIRKKSVSLPGYQEIAHMTTVHLTRDYSTHCMSRLGWIPNKHLYHCTSTREGAFCGHAARLWFDRKLSLCDALTNRISADRLRTMDFSKFSAVIPCMWHSRSEDSTKLVGHFLWL
jgi:hypothetical protein